MSEADLSAIRGWHILAVEDEYLIAAELVSVLEDAGAHVVGPVPSVKDALSLLQSGTHIDCAILDINLGKERVYPLAEQLARRGVPFVFTTGYDQLALPEEYKHVLRCEKPIDAQTLLRLLAAATIINVAH